MDLTFLNESESSDNSSLDINTLVQNATFNIKWWQAFDKHYLLHDTTWTVIIILAYMSILIVGLVGNCLVILAYVFRPKMRTVTNLFIMNLAVADLLAVLFCFIGNLLSNTTSHWILGLFMCKAVGYVQGMSICASAHLLVAISVDRCKAIYRPLVQPKGLRRHHAIYTIIGIWFLAICLPLPWTITLTVTHEHGISHCGQDWKNEFHEHLYFLCVNFVIFYLLPLVLIIITKVMIWYRISRRQVPSAIASATAIVLMHRQTRHGVRKMLGIVTTTFVLSWLPLYALMIRYRYFPVDESEIETLYTLLSFAQWLGSCNSSVNPVLYAFLNAKFRAAFCSFLPSCRKVNRRSRSLTATSRTNNNGMIELGQMQRCPK